jgi:hypothetical protein
LEAMERLKSGLERFIINHDFFSEVFVITLSKKHTA